MKDDALVVTEELTTIYHMFNIHINDGVQDFHYCGVGEWNSLGVLLTWRF